MSNGATRSIYDLDKDLKFILAGVFETTPTELFIHLGGMLEHFDDAAKQAMEMHLRAFGYSEQTYHPFHWSPVRTSWVRINQWPEDKVWLNGDLTKILDHLEEACDRP
jgi:hypothetical protein